MCKQYTLQVTTHVNVLGITVAINTIRVNKRDVNRIMFARNVLVYCVIVHLYFILFMRLLASSCTNYMSLLVAIL